jgi:hypothetical protein
MFRNRLLSASQTYRLVRQRAELRSKGVRHRWLLLNRQVNRRHW